MKATTLLKKQHRVVEGLFKKLSGSGPKKELLQGLANNLVAHMASSSFTAG